MTVKLALDEEVLQRELENRDDIVGVVGCLYLTAYAQLWQITLTKDDFTSHNNGE